MIKKIIHIIPSLNSGGAERMLYKLVKYSDKSKYVHEIVTLTPAGFYEKEIKEMNIQVYSLSLNNKKKIIKSLYLLWKITKQADIVQSWMYHSDLLAFIFGKVLSKKKVIWGIRRSYLEKRLMKRLTLMIAKVCSYFSRNIDAIICNSTVGKYAHVKLGYSGENMEVIPNGFELDIFNVQHCKSRKINEDLIFNTGTTVISNIARWEPLKDHRTLLEAISILKEDLDNLIILLCGKGIDYKNRELVSWIKELDLGKEVRLLGVRNDIPEILSISDLYVSSSISEGFPNVIGEAMASELYCIATDAGDTKYIIDDFGTVVPIGNPKKLAESILHAINMDKADFGKVKFLARKRIKEEFSIQNIVRQYEEIYEKINHD